MQQKDTRKQKEEKLKILIQKSILIDDTDAVYWLSKLPTMPDGILTKVIAAIEKRNKLAEKYIQQALKNNEKGASPEEMKELVNTTRKTAVALEEQYQNARAEEKILKQIDNI